MLQNTNAEHQWIKIWDSERVGKRREGSVWRAGDEEAGEERETCLLPTSFLKSSLHLAGITSWTSWSHTPSKSHGTLFSPAQPPFQSHSVSLDTTQLSHSWTLRNPNHCSWLTCLHLVHKSLNWASRFLITSCPWLWLHNLLMWLLESEFKHSVTTGRIWVASTPETAMWVLWSTHLWGSL